MKTGLIVLTTLVVMALFWYGHTYSLTISAFVIQGWIGAILPPLAGAWLFAAGWVIRGMRR